MKTSWIYVIGIMILCSGIIHSQDWARWTADSTKIQIVKTKDGSRIRARVIDISAERVTVRIYSEIINLPTDSIQSIKAEDRVVLDQEGRTKLLITSTTLTLGYYAWGIPSALHIKSQRAFAAGYLFLSAGGFFLPYYLTKKTEVSDASATAYYYGSTRGIVHGLVLCSIINDQNYSDRTRIGLSVSASIAEGVGFYYLAGKLNYTGGRAEAVGTYGDFGSFNFGILAPTILDINGNRATGTLLLAGSALGLGVGHYLTASEEYTRGDATALMDAGILGGYTGLTLSTLGGAEDDEKTTCASILIGDVVGLGVGHYILKNKNFTTGEGFMIRLSMLAGSLAGGGIAYLISKEPEPKLYSSLTCLGALGGYAVMFNSYSGSSENTISQKSPMNFYFNPLALLMKEPKRTKTPAPLAGMQLMF